MKSILAKLNQHLKYFITKLFFGLKQLVANYGYILLTLLGIVLLIVVFILYDLRISGLPELVSGIGSTFSAVVALYISKHRKKSKVESEVYLSHKNGSFIELINVVESKVLVKCVGVSIIHRNADSSVEVVIPQEKFDNRLNYTETFSDWRIWQLVSNEQITRFYLQKDVNDTKMKTAYQFFNRAYQQLDQPRYPLIDCEIRFRFLKNDSTFKKVVDVSIKDLWRYKVINSRK